MTADRWQQIKRHFQAALDQPADERAAFIVHHCPDDALRGEVERLLRQHEQTGEFLETTPPEDILNLPPTSAIGRDGADVHAAATLSMGPGLREAPGARIGRYTLRQLVGEGGFGSVWLADQHEPVRRRVALKLIKLGMDTRQVIARFEAERQALAVMDHPHVAKVFDAGATETGRPYFVMEYVQGVSITEHCDRHKLSVRERLELFIQVCEAVQHAHQKGIIHRDLKPSNILVEFGDSTSAKANPKVIDFGVAKAIAQPLTAATLFTEQGQLIGTPAYMSPEQAELSAQDIDTRSDIYSLGVLLYELLTGMLPFDPTTLRAAGLAQIQRIIREVDPPRPSTKLSVLGRKTTDATRAMPEPLAPHSAAQIAHRRRTETRALLRALRGDLDWITMKALEKDRTRRYASASDFAADIRRHLTHEPVTAGPPSRAYRARKFIRRNRGAVVATAVVFVTLIAGIAGTGTALLREAAQRRTAQAAQTLADKRAAEAERERRVQEAVTNYLGSIIRSASPVALGKDARIVDALDLVSKSVTGQFPEAPLVEGAVRENIGMLYVDLGKYDLAEPHLVRAAEILKRELPAEHPDRQTSMNNLATLYYNQGRLEHAEAHFREVLDAQRKTASIKNELTLNTANNLANILMTRGRYEEAESLLTEAVEASGGALGEGHAQTQRSMSNLGRLYRATGRLAEAEPLLLRVLDIRRGAYPMGDANITNSMIILAGLYKSQLRFEEAEPLFQEALDAHRRGLGEAHPDTLNCMNNLAGLYLAAGRFEQAEPLLVCFVEGAGQSLPARHHRKGLFT